MAKRVPPLSAATLTKFKPDPVKVLELVDGAVPGLRVRITPAGTRSWSLNIRAQGKMRRFDVGQWVEVKASVLNFDDEEEEPNFDDEDADRPRGRSHRGAARAASAVKPQFDDKGTVLGHVLEVEFPDDEDASSERFTYIVHFEDMKENVRIGPEDMEVAEGSISSYVNWKGHFCNPSTEWDEKLGMLYDGYHPEYW